VKKTLTTISNWTQKKLKEISEEGYDSKFEKAGVDSGATTVVCLLAENGVLVVANAGDSRCLVGRKRLDEDNKENIDTENGHEKEEVKSSHIAIDMSIDHKPEDPRELQRIITAGGCLSPDGRVDGGLNLSRALGDHCYKKTYALPLSRQKISPKPDIRAIQLTKNDDFIVIACDGIWNVMSSQAVTEFVADRLSKMELKEITEELLDQCLAPDTKGDGTGCDNMTVVIVKLTDKFKKTAPALDDLDMSLLDKNIEKHDLDTEVNPNTNPSDGSAQLVGKLLSDYRKIDFTCNAEEVDKMGPFIDKNDGNINPWKNKVEETISEKNTSESSPPTKKSRIF